MARRLIDRFVTHLWKSTQPELKSSKNKKKISIALKTYFWRPLLVDDAILDVRKER
jgi:hypothetical protein